MNERVKNIKTFAKARDNAIEEKLRLQNENIASLKLKIDSMKEEIKEIIEVGNACVENKIPLYRTLMEYGGYEKNNFKADGVNHILGFKIPRPGEKITQIGFSGGGACCYEYFYVDVEGKMYFKENSRDFLSAEEYILTSFVNNFEEFKSHFYAYVDKIVQS